MFQLTEVLNRNLFYSSRRKWASLYILQEGSAASKITPLDISKEYLSHAKILHLSAITQAISGTSCETALKAIDQAKKKGLKISYDSNFRIKLWSLEHGRVIVNSTIPLCDLILPSLEDSIFKGVQLARHKAVSDTQLTLPTQRIV